MLTAGTFWATWQLRCLHCSPTCRCLASLSTCRPSCSMEWWSSTTASVASCSVRGKQRARIESHNSPLIYIVDTSYAVTSCYCRWKRRQSEEERTTWRLFVQFKTNILSVLFVSIHLVLNYTDIACDRFMIMPSLCLIKICEIQCRIISRSRCQGGLGFISALHLI